MTAVSATDRGADASLPPRSFRIFLRDYDLKVDIGFHEFEIGAPQRLILSVDVWVDAAHFAAEDHASAAWNYDDLRTEIARTATSRRWNLQETLVRALYDLVSARPGVIGLTVSARKPDIYPDCAAVGVELSSFSPIGAG